MKQTSEAAFETAIKGESGKSLTAMKKSQYAFRLLDMDPQAMVIVASGFANDPIMSEYADYGFKEVIPKPYKLNELGRVLRE
jgi:hypothetical protein